VGWKESVEEREEKNMRDNISQKVFTSELNMGSKGSKDRRLSLDFLYIK